MHASVPRNGACTRWVPRDRFSFPAETPPWSAACPDATRSDNSTACQDGSRLSYRMPHVRALSEPLAEDA